MHTRFGRIVIAWALVLLTVWLGERLYRGYVSVVDEPKLVTPGGKLSDWEKSNIELFRVAGTSVAYITTEQVRFNPFRGASVAQGAGVLCQRGWPSLPQRLAAHLDLKGPLSCMPLTPCKRRAEERS